MSGNIDKNKITDSATKDIIELHRKIELFKQGDIPEERFKHFRLTRGVYGQRQVDVHMFRTKIPYGKLTPEQLIQLADVSEKYTNGNLHLTTRQNVQMHYVKLNDATAIWTELAEQNITAREACGNTVRNITGSARIGIDPNEPFDVSPYIDAVFNYFLRNPICQEMGRKIKISFSASAQDSAFGYFHDFGFIPVARKENDKIVHGFKVLIAGGLGAQSIVAQEAFDFLPSDRIIPFLEAAIRIFDRFGEREKRQKARLKFLVKKLGISEFLNLVATEEQALKSQSIPIAYEASGLTIPKLIEGYVEEKPIDKKAYDTWRAGNVFAQKQQGFLAVNLRIPLGNLHANQARSLAKIVDQFAAPDIRITVNQGLLLRFVHPAYLPALFNALHPLGFAIAGFDSLGDITACPGTETCNLGVTNSTGIVSALETVVREEFPHLVNESSIKIKISGCMNACGQHMAAAIGLHGSSIKKKSLVIPAMQIVLGGGIAQDGQGFIADKIIKLPTKRIPEALRSLLHDFESTATTGEYFNEYVRRLGKKYFYNLLKSLAQLENISPELLIDWGEEKSYAQAIGVGECAGVAYDLVSTILEDAREKIDWADQAIAQEAWPDALHHSYSALVTAAKAILLQLDIRCNTHIGILNDFQTHVYNARHFSSFNEFPSWVLRYRKQPPTPQWAKEFLGDAKNFVQKIHSLLDQIKLDEGNKSVISNFYNA